MRSLDLGQAMHYPLGDEVPIDGHALEIADGIKWLRMPLPFALNHVNLWLLRDRWQQREGWTVIDCCIDSVRSRELWDQVFANELEGLPILRVIVTHMHPDHIGLAHWLCKHWNSPLWVSGTEFHMARYSSKISNSFGGERQANYFRNHGMLDQNDLAKIRERNEYYSGLVPTVPDSFYRLMEGMEITIGERRWRCIVGYGHSPEHMAFHCEEFDLLISGDMILPRISTNVSVYEIEPEADPLKLFLDSVDRFKTLRHETLILPSHGNPFVGLHTRINQLHEHHRDRLAEVMTVARSFPVTAFDIVPVLFKRHLDLHQITFAMGEAVAHLHRLWYDGQLKRVCDNDGVFRFSAI